jgi:glycosyltransferase involved in cell wall biosynthesis
LKVLIVSFLYAPFNSMGGLGVSKLSSHMLEQGWDVHVLCARHDDVPADIPVEIPEDRVVRTGFVDVNALPKLFLGRSHVVRRGFEFRRRGLLTRLGRAYWHVVNFPDGQIGWLPVALKAGAELIRKAPPDVIVGFGPPWTSHLVASELARRFRIHWVARYHDPWTDSRTRERVWPLGALERALEDRTARSAAAIVAGSEGWRAELAARFPTVPVRTVFFGFEPSEYPPAPEPTGLPLRVLYTGRLYERQDPGKVFDAVRSLLADGRVAANEIELRFTGRYLEVAQRALERVDLPAGVVRISEPVPRADIPALQQAAGALVLFLGEDDDVGLLPGKMWEYVGARRPILVVGGSERHEAVEILRRGRVGTWAADAPGIADVLASWVATLRRSERLYVDPDASLVRRHTWHATAEVMGQLLRDVVQRSVIRVS